MYILALDNSTKQTGYAVFDSNTNELIKSGVFCATSNNLVERIIKMTGSVCSVVEQMYPIGRIVMEEVIPKTYGNVSTLKALLWLQGSLMITFYDICPETRVDFIYPSSWRSQLGIKTGPGVKREQLKQADIDYVKQKYNITVGDDEADAICIGLAYLQTAQFDWE